MGNGCLELGIVPGIVGLSYGLSRLQPSFHKLQTLRWVGQFLLCVEMLSLKCSNQLLVDTCTCFPDVDRCAINAMSWERDIGRE